VIHNLLQNAQDTLVGITDPTITVRTGVLQSSVSLSVSDNGSGFPDEVRARAFEPYVTTKPKGTGLGLPIVKKIVEEHNGTIQIENTLPHGARISITLPMTVESITATKTETV
jgi:nitrogen fixation/metabolism regulation signal transduction histidine kinase